MQHSFFKLIKCYIGIRYIVAKTPQKTTEKNKNKKEQKSQKNPTKKQQKTRRNKKKQNTHACMHTHTDTIQTRPKTQIKRQRNGPCDGDRSQVSHTWSQYCTSVWWNWLHAMRGPVSCWLYMSCRELFVRVARLPQLPVTPSLLKHFSTCHHITQ